MNSPEWPVERFERHPTQPAAGWLRISADDLRSDDQLALSVKIGTGYARSLPPRAFE